MTAYKLPDALGGSEVDVLGDQTPTRVLADYVWVRHSQLGMVQLNRNALTEVRPALAKEPPTGGAAASEYTVWLHAHNGWFDGFDTADGSGDPIEFFTWPELNRRHPELRVLVYDPLADSAAPDLPYRLETTTGGNYVTVGVKETGFIEASGSGRVLMTASDAERMGSAYFAAARASREAS